MTTSRLAGAALAAACKRARLEVARLLGDAEPSKVDAPRRRRQIPGQLTLDHELRNEPKEGR